MIPDKLKEVIADAWQKGLQTLQKLDQRSHGWLGIIAQAARETMTPRSAITAAAIAYFALFSIFPLILVSIFIASFHLIPLVNQQFILNKLEFIAPALGRLLGPNIQRIITTRGTVTLIALIGLVWSASTVFNTLNQTMSELWGYRRVRPVWEQRGLAVLVVLVFAGPLLVLVSFGGSLLTTVYSWLPFQSALLATVIGLVLAVVLNIALFALLYYVFPHGKSTWREILPGAIGAGLLWEVGKQAFLAFVSGYLSASNLVYGSVAAIIAFLTWAYLSGLIFVFGAHLSQSYFNHEQVIQEK